VFTPAYYPSLLALYEEAGVEVDAVDYAASFSRLGGETYFVYRNARIGGRSLPWIPPSSLLAASTRAIARDALRLHRRGPAHLESGHLADRTLGDYLESEGYDPAFIEGFMLPAYASVCTCSTDAVRAYPAEVIVRYFCSGVTTLGVMRTVGGSSDVIRRLMAHAHDVRTGTAVRGIVHGPDAVRVIDAAGGVEHYDHVVLATPADRGAELVEGDERLRRALSRVPHESSRIVVHRDPNLAPRDRGSWRPVNFIVAEAGAAPMATIWLNAVQDGLAGAADVFQTWNPIGSPDPATVVAEAVVSRPVVTLATRDVPARLAALRSDPERRIWPVGSYAQEGIPLLEAAAASALRVAEALERRRRLPV
jgi:predicted NAD/FAD-binding protein